MNIGGIASFECVVTHTYDAGRTNRGEICRAEKIWTAVYKLFGAGFKSAMRSVKFRV